VSALRATDLLVVPELPDERTKTDDAVKFLRSILAACPLPSGEVFKAARQAGISERTLQRARLKVATTVKGSMNDGWMWALRKPATPSKETAPSQKVASSGEVASSAVSQPSEGATSPEDAKKPEGAIVSKGEGDLAPSPGDRTTDL
jgi:hypothetical protein